MQFTYFFEQTVIDNGLQPELVQMDNFIPNTSAV